MKATDDLITRLDAVTEKIAGIAAKMEESQALLGELRQSAAHQLVEQYLTLTIGPSNKECSVLFGKLIKLLGIAQPFRIVDLLKHPSVFKLLCCKTDGDLARVFVDWRKAGLIKKSRYTGPKLDNITGEEKWWYWETHDDSVS